MNSVFLSLMITSCFFAGACVNQPVRMDVRFVTESAKQQLDRASLVVLAKVLEVKDGKGIRSDSSFRGVEVRLRVEKVLKGNAPGEEICMLYFLPTGNYNGPVPQVVGKDEAGFFALQSSGRCFRAVNDRRAVFRSFAAPNESIPDTDELVARATFPIPGACSGSGMRNIPEDILFNTFSLIGPRAAREIAEGYVSSPDPIVASCACSTIATLWRLHAGCLDDLTAGARKVSLLDLDELQKSDRQVFEQELSHFQLDPASWLDESIRATGTDGALLKLRDIIEVKNPTINKQSCGALNKYVESASFTSARSEGAKWSAQRAERSAESSLRDWLQGSCHNFR